MKCIMCVILKNRKSCSKKISKRKNIDQFVATATTWVCLMISFPGTLICSTKCKLKNMVNKFWFLNLICLPYFFVYIFCCIPLCWGRRAPHTNSGGCCCFKSAFSATPTRVGRSSPVNPSIDRQLPVRTQLVQPSHHYHPETSWKWQETT